MAGADAYVRHVMGSSPDDWRSSYEKLNQNGCNGRQTTFNFIIID